MLPLALSLLPSAPWNVLAVNIVRFVRNGFKG